MDFFCSIIDLLLKLPEFFDYVFCFRGKDGFSAGGSSFSADQKGRS